MGGKMSRDKGARSERALRDELLRQGWRDVRRVPLSGAVKTNLAYQDDVVGTAPDGKEYRFENKARATGFDSIYALLAEKSTISVAFPEGQGVSISLDPNAAIALHTHLDLGYFGLPAAKVLKSVRKKCLDWIGNAQVLSLKQDRKPFIYIRYYR